MRAEGVSLSGKPTLPYPKIESRLLVLFKQLSVVVVKTSAHTHTHTHTLSLSLSHTHTHHTITLHRARGNVCMCMCMWICCYYQQAGKMVKFIRVITTYVRNKEV
jgi:hypothetical protein